MSDVINGVSRELLERAASIIEPMRAWRPTFQELRALLTAQPQASAAQSAPDEREAVELALLREYRLSAIAFSNSHGVETDTLEEAVEIERKAEARLEAAEKACWDFYGNRGAAWQRAQSAPVVPEKIESIRLWFFRDLSDSQRLGLFSICGWPAHELTTHSAQSLVLRKLLAAAPQPDQFVEATDMVTARQEQGE